MNRSETDTAAETVSKDFSEACGVSVRLNILWEQRWNPAPKQPPMAGLNEAGTALGSPPHCRGLLGWRAGASTPFFVEHPQVQRGAQQRPLGAHSFQPPYRPTPEAVVLLELGKARFDDLTSALPLCLRGRFLQPRAHGLHRPVVRPDFDLPPFGVARTVVAHRTVALMTTKTFHALAVFRGVALVIQSPALRTGDGVGSPVIMKVLRGVGIVARGFALGRRGQTVHLFLGGGLQVGAAAVTRVGEGQSVRPGPAEISPRLLDHGCQLAHIVFLPGRRTRR